MKMEAEIGVRQLATSQGMLRIANSHQNLEEVGKGYPLRASRGNHLCQHVDFRFLVARIMTE